MAERTPVLGGEASSCIGLIAVMSVTRAAPLRLDGTSAIWLNIFALIAVLWSTMGGAVMIGCQF